jgi:protease-4
MAMSTARKAFLIIGGIILALVLVSAIGIALLFAAINKSPTISNNSVLVLKVSGDMPDFVPEDPTARFFGADSRNSFASLLTQLRKAKADTRIGGVLLDIDTLGIGLGKSDELRGAIADFRTSGKPIYAYMESGFNKEYYIATACDKIFVPPTGDLYITGFKAEPTFYKGSLDKLGIEYDNVAIGKYKGVNDPLTRKDLSEGQREVLNALLDDYYTRFANAIAETRQKSVEDVKAIIDNAPYNALQAREQNLIDGAFYRDQVIADFKNRLGYSETDELKTTTATKYKEITPESIGLNNGERIAVIFASGIILPGKSNDGSFGGTQTIGSDTIVKAVRDAANDNSIKAIVLRVDSGGGSALASDLMHHAIEYAKTKKPVVTSMGDVAASGGYYIACNSNKIVAEPSTITGSIGVIIGKPALRGLYDWLGVTTDESIAARGRHAGLFSVTDKWTPEERAVFENSARHTYYDNFIPKVAAGRGKTVEEIDAVGQGRVWTGFQAKDKGLVDEFGGLNRAIEIAKQLANLPVDKDVKRVVFPTPRPFFETIFSSDDEEAAAMISAKEQAQQEAILKALPKDAQKAFRFAAIFNNFEPGETLTMMPFALDFK